MRPCVTALLGAAATFDDLMKIGVRDQLVIELSTVITVLTILLIVYRSLVAMFIPLITIGLSMVVAQQVVAVHPWDTAETLYARLETAAIGLLTSAWPDAVLARWPGVVQSSIGHGAGVRGRGFRQFGRGG